MKKRQILNPDCCMIMMEDYDDYYYQQFICVAGIALILTLTLTIQILIKHHSWRTHSPEVDLPKVLHETFKVKTRDNNVVSLSTLVVRHPPSSSVVNTDPATHVIIVIPGNPGVASFYHSFLQHLAAHCYTNPAFIGGGAVEVVCIAHSGHEFSSSTNTNVIYTLAEQIEHKRLYYESRRQSMPTSSKFYIVGHSIGSYLSMQLQIDSSISKFVLMQPTLRRMRESPNGKRMSWLFPHAKNIGFIVRYTLEALPTALTRTLVKAYLIYSGTSPRKTHLVRGIVSLLYGDVSRNVFSMAAEEMDAVVDVKAESHVDESKYAFLYSGVDGWVPEDSIKVLKQRFSQSEHHTNVKVPHAFMLSHTGCETMAALVSKYLLSEKE